MIAEVANRRDEIAALCRTYGVRRLELFGSAARGDFDPETSDFDFILELDDSEGNLLGRFIGLGDALEELLGRPADFVFEEKLTNPYLRASINRNRELLYGEAGRSQRSAVSRA